MWARGLSLLAGSAITLALLLDPRLLGSQLGPVQHSALPLILLGVSAAFIHGVGFRPETKLARLFLGPAAAWLFIASGAALLVLER